MQFCIKRVIKKLDETIRGGGYNVSRYEGDDIVFVYAEYSIENINLKN